MLLKIYKGFDSEFYKNITFKSLVDGSINERVNVLSYNKNFILKLSAALLAMKDDDVRWITYDEFSLVKDAVLYSINLLGLNVEFIINNMLPDVYKLNFALDDEIYLAYTKSKENIAQLSSHGNEIESLVNIFNDIAYVNNVYYGTYYNYEYDKIPNAKVINYYPQGEVQEYIGQDVDYSIFANEDIAGFLEDYEKIIELQPKIISFNSTHGQVSKRIKAALLAFARANNIQVVSASNILQNESVNLEDLKSIAKNDIKIPNFKGFRELEFYKDPDVCKKTIKISQAVIISDIIMQAEKAYSEDQCYRDLFITAPTGAGKSVMFQIPAIYLAKKHKKLTIVIQPVLALMQDQIDHLKTVGYTRVEALNSMLATQVEKEAVIKKIKDGDVDLLYLSPETLLAYSMETIIGDREIGLIIIDEAHIVTTWGAGFRPDYWYLGSYLNGLRNRIQTAHNKKKKVFRFPICAFTATAINGGTDDTVSETIVSLYMNNPKKYIGNVKRSNIQFDINVVKNQKLNTKTYETEKAVLLGDRVRHDILSERKMIVYFPYARTVKEAYYGYNNFADIYSNKNRIATFVGSNFDGLSKEAIATRKKEVLAKFKTGEYAVVYATKAFGMGVDVNDIDDVYHYAITGNLSDYIQEVGRAARKQSMTGHAIIDFYQGDISFMKMLFGMSQIRQYQINKVIMGVYDAYLRNNRRNFLISPQSFSHIFAGASKETKEVECTNKLKTCLLMLEKDFWDKYNFKVLISRPQSIFTKGFVCIIDAYQQNVLKSKYGKYFTFVSPGRKNVKMHNGTYVSDLGDIYSIDLKSVWEDFYPNISFPQFKYWYFYRDSKEQGKYEIMPEIQSGYRPRQKITIKAKNENLLSEIKQKMLDEVEYIGDLLFEKFHHKYFTTNDFVNAISPKYGRTTANVIGNSLFDLVDPDHQCVKPRKSEDMENYQYTISNGTFKEIMKKSIIKSSLMSKISMCDAAEFTEFIGVTSGEFDLNIIALKLLSLFEFISYEVQGGQEPEIFIRLNDPNKLRAIVKGEIKYSNNYVIRAKQKHERDVDVLLKFFTSLNNSKDRWDFVENYFLGEDVLYEPPKVGATSPLASVIEKVKSYSLASYQNWDDIYSFFEDDMVSILMQFKEQNIPMPDYMSVCFKKDIIKSKALIAWSSKNTLIFDNDVSDKDLSICASKGWNAYRIFDVETGVLKGVLK